MDTKTDVQYQSNIIYGMGTEIVQNIEKSEKYDATDILDITKTSLRELESRLSFFLPNSSISRINRNSGCEIPVDKDTLSVLTCAKRVYEISNGAFDITAASLISLWRKYRKLESVPPLRKIERALAKTDGSKLEISKDQGTVRIAKGQLIDLGGIGKGYAADEIAKIYNDCGVKSAFINLGGNVLTLGEKVDGSLWSIGIQNPRAPRGNCLGVLTSENSSIVTSGDYERCYFVDGIRYHHIIDTKTGYPSDNGLLSVTVVNRSSMLADAMSTAAFVIGLEKGVELIRKFDDTQAIFITKDKDVFVTKGLKDSFSITDSGLGYKYYYC